MVPGPSCRILTQLPHLGKGFPSHTNPQRALGTPSPFTHQVLGDHEVTALPHHTHSRVCTSGRGDGAHHPGGFSSLVGTGSQSPVSPPGPSAARPCSSPGRHWMGLRSRLPAQLARPGGTAASARCFGGCQAGRATAATIHAGCWGCHQSRMLLDAERVSGSAWTRLEPSPPKAFPRSERGDGNGEGELLPGKALMKISAGCKMR